jgi:hypothetical protein
LNQPGALSQMGQLPTATWAAVMRELFIVLLLWLSLIKSQALFEQPEHQTQAQINRGEKAIDQHKGQKQVVHRQISHAIKPVIVLHLAVSLVEFNKKSSLV